MRFELIVMIFLLLLIASVAVPRGYIMIQRAALDYETANLTAELRSLFRQERTVYYQSAYFRTPRPSYFDDFALIPEKDGYRVENKFARTIKRHKCLPGIHVQVYGSKTKIRPNSYGYTNDNTTIVLYFGNELKNWSNYRDRRYVIVDVAGRVRVDWHRP